MHLHHSWLCIWQSYTKVKESTTDIVIKRLAITLKGLKCFVCQNGRGFQVVLPWTSQGRFEWRLMSRSRNLQTTPSWKKLSAHWGDIGKWERGQSKNQHNNFSKISTKSERETKCVNTKWEAQMAEYWGQQWVTRVINNGGLQQKANSCPCADRSRSNYWAIQPQRPPLETTNRDNLLWRKGMRGMVGYSTSPTEGDTEKKISACCLEPAIRNLLNS